MVLFRLRGDAWRRACLESCVRFRVGLLLRQRGLLLRQRLGLVQRQRLGLVKRLLTTGLGRLHSAAQNLGLDKTFFMLAAVALCDAA